MADGKIEFSPEQQEKLDSLIRDAMSRAGREGREEAERTRTELAATKAELDALRGNPDSVLKTAKELEEARTELATVRTQRQADMVKNALENAAQQENVLDPQIAAQLLKQHVKAGEDGELQVVSETGTPRLNADFSPMTVTQLMHEFAISRPFLVRGVVKGGIGSSENMRPHYRSPEPLTRYFGSKANGNDTMRLKKENPEEYKRLRKLAQSQNLI